MNNNMIITDNLLISTTIYDLFCFSLNDNLKLRNESDLIFYNNKNNENITLYENENDNILIDNLSINLNGIDNKITEILIIGSLKDNFTTNIALNVYNNDKKMHTSLYTHGEIIELLSLTRIKEGWMLKMLEINSTLDIAEQISLYYDGIIKKKINKPNQNGRTYNIDDWDINDITNINDMFNKSLQLNTIEFK